jgi:DNA-binding transcriptional LysR family regulator
MEVGSNGTIMEMLDRGKHVSFLPHFAVAEDLAKNKLYHIKIEGVRIKRTLWIARSRTNLNNPVAEAFIRLLREERS